MTDSEQARTHLNNAAYYSEKAADKINFGLDYAEAMTYAALAKEKLSKAMEILANNLDGPHQ